MLDFKNQSYYDILEVGPDASFSEIKTAYYRIKSTYSKDSPALYSIFDENESRELLSKVEIAYLVLSNAEKRREYDKTHGFIGAQDITPVVAPVQDKAAAPRSGKITAGPAPTTRPQKYTPPTAGADFQPQAIVSTPPLSEPQRGTDAYNSTVAPHIPIKENVLSVIRRHSVVKPYAPNPEIDQQIETETEFTGAFLKKVREYKNVLIEELSDFTKISKNYLTAIEGEDYPRLPARVFLRGFLSQIAKALKLDADKMIAGYMKRYDANHSRK